MKWISGDMKLVSGDMKLVSGDMKLVSGDMKLVSGAVNAKPCQPRGAKALWDCEHTSRQVCFAI